MFGGTNKMPQKTCEKAKTIVLPIALFVGMFVLQIALASAANATYDQILQPIQAVYDLVKYAVTIIAGLVMLFAGITYITSGSDPGKREQAKNMIMYVIIGLAVIWAAPFIVKLVMGS
jgi:multisubunit Na+/H+ antiporter MnhB subunit